MHASRGETRELPDRPTNGPIEVVAAEGDSVVIRVEKSWHMSDPQIVKIIPVPTERGLTVCAVWEARDGRCDDGGDYHMNGVKKNDVAVRFTVELPRNVPVNASTVNGGLEIDGVSAPVEAATVNGRIAVSTSAGPVQATTVNGSIEANMQSLTGGDVRLTTVNGSVSAGLPVQLNAEIDAETGAITVIAQEPGQSIPGGEEVTRPDPAPTTTTETLAPEAKFAPTWVSCESSRSQPSGAR